MGNIISSVYDYLYGYDALDYLGKIYVDVDRDYHNYSIIKCTEAIINILKCCKEMKYCLNMYDAARILTDIPIPCPVTRYTCNDLKFIVQSIADCEETDDNAHYMPCIYLAKVLVKSYELYGLEEHRMELMTRRIFKMCLVCSSFTCENIPEHD